jgi:hypothetical protein
MSSDYMKPANAPASGTGSASGAVPDSYPPYTVEFKGDGVTGPILVSGPHTFALAQGSGSMFVSLTRKDADGKPNLAVTFSTTPPPTGA